MTWKVQLTGGKADLVTLAQSLIGTDINISLDGEDYVLTSDRFHSLSDAETVRQHANVLVKLLNGASRLALDFSQSIGVGNVYRCRADGTREIFLFPDSGRIRFTLSSPTLTVTHVDGTEEEIHPADPIRDWMPLALSDSSVADVFRFMASIPLDWVNLYRILDVIRKDVGGSHVIVFNGWATDPSLRLFKHTACSPGAVGLEARHGADFTRPPANPMTISEARNLIMSIVHAWLRAKTGR